MVDVMGCLRTHVVSLTWLRVLEIHRVGEVGHRQPPLHRHTTRKGGSLKWPSTFVGAGVLTSGHGEMLARKVASEEEEVDVVLNAVCLGDVKAYLPWLSHELRDARSDDLHEAHYTHSLMRAKNAWVKQAARYDELRNYDPNGHYPY